MKSISVKKLLIALISLIGLFALFSVTAYAEDYGNFAYSSFEPDDGEDFTPYIEISGYSENDEAADSVVEIPSTIEEVAVTTIGASAFSWKSTLTEVIIPDSVTSIDNGAFYHSQNLKVAIIPDSVTYIGESAFQDCTSLEYVIIGNGVKTIGDLAFKGCTSLKGVSIGTGVETIGNGAFFDCHALKGVYVPAGVKSIGSKALGFIQSGNNETVTDGFAIFTAENTDTIRGYSERNLAEAQAEVTNLTGYTVPVEIVAACAADSHDAQWVTVRTATESYVGADLALCSKCFSLSIRDNTEVPPAEEDTSARTTLIVCLVLVAAFAVLVVIYVKRSKARRIAAKADYAAGKPLASAEELAAKKKKKADKEEAKREKALRKMNEYNVYDKK